MGLDLPVEAEPHLRAVLEAQPVVLTRVGKDGTFLAINEAGLSMLGAQSLEQILGTSMVSLVSSDERKNCQTFLERTAAGQRGSLEVDLVGLTGTRHTLELHACPHPGAPDAIASVLITFRDVTESRRLEQSLVDAAARQAEQESAYEAERSRLLADVDMARRAQSDQLVADEQLTELERRLAEGDEKRAEAASRHAAEIAELNDALAAERRRADEHAALAARLGDGDAQLADLRSRHDALEAERQQLLEMAGLLRSEAEARQATLTELTERLETLDAERQQATDAANALRLDLDDRHATVAELTSRLELLEADHQQTTESSAQLRRELESRNSLATELAARIEALEAEQAGLKASADATLEQLLQQQERYATDTGALRDALNDAMGEQARLAEAAAATEEDAAQKTALLATLEQTLNDERAAAEARLSDAYESQASRLQEIEAAHAARLEEMEASQQSRLAEIEAAHAARVHELEASHAAGLSELEAAHAARLSALEAELAGRGSELEAALAEARARAEDAAAAVRSAEESWAAEKRKLEDALLSAVDGERTARSALAGEIAARTAVERAHQQLQQAIGRLAGGVVAAPGAAPALASTTAKDLAGRLETELPRRLGDGLELSLLVATSEALIAMEESEIVNAIGTFADSRCTSMLSGQVTVELAEVAIDDGAGRARGLTPGDYVLVAMNVEGPGAQQGFPAEIFDTADPRGWRELRGELQAARATIFGAGGQVWLTKEGASILMIELYLPRGDAGAR